MIGKALMGSVQRGRLLATCLILASVALFFRNGSARVVAGASPADADSHDCLPHSRHWELLHAYEEHLDATIYLRRANVGIDRATVKPA